MAEKGTRMKLKVDLKCEKCSKKVRKLLAKYPQIREQQFDEKANFVMILVVCCSPEKIRDDLCCKGGGCIISIEILEPPTPTPTSTSPKCVCGCCEGGRGGPCVNVYIGPLVCCDGYCGRPCYHGSHCVQYYYFSEENASGCTIL